MNRKSNNSINLLDTLKLFFSIEKKTKKQLTATGKFLPNRFLANSPSTSSGLRGFKSLDLYNIRFTEYILCHFDHVSRGT